MGLASPLYSDFTLHLLVGNFALGDWDTVFGSLSSHPLDHSLATAT